LNEQASASPNRSLGANACGLASVVSGDALDNFGFAKKDKPLHYSIYGQ
jgi:hypothetical protein